MKTNDTAAMFFHMDCMQNSSRAALALHEKRATVNLLLQPIGSSEVGNEQEGHVTHMIVITVHFLPQDATSPSPV